MTLFKLNIGLKKQPKTNPNDTTGIKMHYHTLADGSRVKHYITMRGEEAR